MGGWPDFRKNAERNRGMRTKAVSLTLSPSAGEVNSFLCLIGIQTKNVFFRFFASTIVEIPAFPNDFETAFL
jgi:hypothetical protein